MLAAIVVVFDLVPLTIVSAVFVGLDVVAVERDADGCHAAGR